MWLYIYIGLTCLKCISRGCAFSAHFDADAAGGKRSDIWGRSGCPWGSLIAWRGGLSLKGHCWLRTNRTKCRMPKKSKVSKFSDHCPVLCQAQQNSGETRKSAPFLVILMQSPVAAQCSFWFSFMLINAPGQKGNRFPTPLRLAWWWWGGRGAEAIRCYDMLSYFSKIFKTCSCK